MTPKEMSVRVLSDISGLAAQRTRKFQPEQIELALNAEVDQYVQDAVQENARGYFTVDSEYYDGIQTLIETNSLSVHTIGAKQSSYVPLNALKLLDVYAFGGYKGSLGTLSTTVTQRIYTCSVTAATLLPAYKNVEFRVGGVSVYQRLGTAGYTTTDLFQLVDELVGAIPGLAWERAYSINRPGKLIYVSEGIAAAVLEIDGVNYTFSLDSAIVAEANTITKNIGMSTRRIKNQMRSEVLSTPYYMPSVVDLPVMFQQGMLEVHTPDSYIVNSLLLTSIRRPRKISLSLGIGCDLAPGCHAQICDRTVQRIRERIGDPKLQTGRDI